MKIISTAFQNNSEIPAKYTCDGENVNPPLTFSDIPQSAKSLVLIMDDPDAPMGAFVHWVLFDINPMEKEIKENSVPNNFTSGSNSAGGENYIGACPPSGTHRYFFKLYALDNLLNLPSKATKAQVENAMLNHILAKAEIIGLYSKEQ